MSEAIIFENMPYNLFLKQRMEFVVICGDHLAANVMRVFEREMIKLKEAWQIKVEKALENKKTPPPEPRTYWIRLSQAQIIARLYMYDSAKLKKPESENLNSPEWVEYRFKKALSISKATLKKAIELLKELGFLIERSKPGDEFGAPIYTLNKVNVQNAMKALPADPFTIFHHLGGVENIESGGDSKIFNVPPKNSDSGESQKSEVPPKEFSTGESQNFEVDIDSSIDTPLDNEIDKQEESTYPQPDRDDDDPGSSEPTRARSCQHFQHILTTTLAYESLTPSEQDELYEHIDQCIECSKLNLQRRGMLTALRAKAKQHAEAEQRINDLQQGVEQELRRKSGALPSQQDSYSQAALAGSDDYEKGHTDDNDTHSHSSQPASGTRRNRAVGAVATATDERAAGSVGRGGRTGKGQGKGKTSYQVCFSIEGAAFRAMYEELTGVKLDETAANARACNALGTRASFSPANLKLVVNEIRTNKWVKRERVGVTVQDLASDDKNLRWEKWLTAAQMATQPEQAAQSVSANHCLYSDEELDRQSDQEWARIQAQLASPEIQAKLAAKGITL